MVVFHKDLCLTCRHNPVRQGLTHRALQHDLGRGPSSETRFSL